MFRVASAPVRKGLGLALGLIVLLCLFGGCNRTQKEIKIGFVGSLTGKFSDLGVAGRNGVILAVEEWNSKGGVNGRPVKLLIEDDAHDPGLAVEADKKLIDSDVLAIIGHMTSEMSIAAYTLVNERKTLMVSPTTSTPLLSGKDDWFIRVVGTSDATPKRLARYAIEKGYRELAAIYSLENKAYSEPYVDIFQEEMEKAGGRLLAKRAISKAESDGFDMVAMEVLATRPEAVVLVLSAIEAAKMCQQIRKLDPGIPILSSGWAMTTDFLTHAGRAGDGVVFVEYYFPTIDTKEMKEFVSRYKARFGSEPTFASIYGYDACNVILQALLKNSQKEKLKETILSIKKFKALSGEFEFDRFGDAVRPFYIVRAFNGEFIMVK